MIAAELLIKLLNLQPRPQSGYYAGTYRSNELIPKEALLERYAGPRSY
jgi:predicted cupin superfamily sugar epimerase